MKSPCARRQRSSSASPSADCSWRRSTPGKALTGVDDGSWRHEGATNTALMASAQRLHWSFVAAASSRCRSTSLPPRVGSSLSRCPRGAPLRTASRFPLIARAQSTAPYGPLVTRLSQSRVMPRGSWCAFVVVVGCCGVACSVGGRCRWWQQQQLQCSWSWLLQVAGSCSAQLSSARCDPRLVSLPSEAARARARARSDRGEEEKGGKDWKHSCKLSALPCRSADGAASK